MMSLKKEELELEKKQVDEFLNQLNLFSREGQIYALLRLGKNIAKHHKVDLRISEKKDAELIHDNIKLNKDRNVDLMFFLKDLK
ncbi:MAG: hypothetical protein ACFFDT_00290 [Candidatus Hodarchaeota archaeon]